MSQTFILTLATDTLRDDASKIGVSAAQLQQIIIKVTASITELANTDHSDTSLSLHYEIRLPSTKLFEQLQWPLWHKDKVGFEDNLWEQTCLECFITNDAASYVEINASPNGQYAVYQFEDYRTPATLPPTPLLIKGSQNPVPIQWHKTASTSSDTLSMQRRLSIALDMLPDSILNPNATAFIHPCVILNFAGTPLYFATAHAAPADFHQRQHWSKLQLDKE